ncbi:MAG TPA: ferritin-like domain-containing protein [Verrucomicrobiae bacterium]
MNTTLKSLFLEELEDMYDAEQRIAKALPKMIEAATCNELKSALDNHLEETKEHAQKLEQVFAAFEATASGTKCEAIVGILDEGETLVKKNKKSTNINAAIICAGQKVEHYEIASYGCLKTWAGMLGKSDAASILEGILDEEKAADETLTDLATSKNEEALEEVQPGALAH